MRNCIRHTIAREELIALLEGEVVHIRSINRIHNKMEDIELCLADIGFDQIRELVLKATER